VLVDAQNNLIENLRKVPGGKRVIALVGVHDLCVVDTDDALLVIPRERCQDVRAIVDALKRRGDPV
jgi:mannose-1-phosphate guanylyltransferase